MFRQKVKISSLFTDELFTAKVPKFTCQRMQSRNYYPGILQKKVSKALKLNSLLLQTGQACCAPICNNLLQFVIPAPICNKLCPNL